MQEQDDSCTLSLTAWKYNHDNRLGSIYLHGKVLLFAGALLQRVLRDVPVPFGDG